MSDERFWSERETHAGIPPASGEHEPAPCLAWIPLPINPTAEAQVDEEDGPAAARHPLTLLLLLLPLI
jgi:hypothetical protein